MLRRLEPELQYNTRTRSARRALRYTGTNLRTKQDYRRNRNIDDDDMLYYQAGAQYYDPHVAGQPVSPHVPPNNRVQGNCAFIEKNKNTKGNVYHINNGTNGTVPQEAMDTLKWAIESLQGASVLPNHENVSKTYICHVEGKAKKVDFTEPKTDTTSKSAEPKSERDLQLNRLIDLVQQTIVKLDSYISLSQQQQYQQIEQRQLLEQQANLLNISSYLLPELPPRVDTITDPQLQSTLLNRIQQKVRSKRTVKVMPVQPLVIMPPPPAPPPEPPVQPVHALRPKRRRGRKQRPSAGIESSPSILSTEKRDCGTTMWCPNPECQCYNGLNCEHEQLAEELSKAPSRGNRLKNTKIVSMRPKKSLSKRNMLSDVLSSISPSSFTEVEHQFQLEQDRDPGYPTEYRELDSGEDWNRLPDNVNKQKSETSDESSETGNRKHGKSGKKSSLRSKMCDEPRSSHKVKFTHLTVHTGRDEPKESNATLPESHLPQWRVLKSMSEAVQTDPIQKKFGKEYYQRCRGGTDYVA